jgi:DNA-binding IclR family transcriptional regulator
MMLKGIELLSLFLEAGGGPLGLTEVSRLAGLNRMSAHRLLQALLIGGLLDYDPELEKYRLGLRLVELGYAARRVLPIVGLAMPVLERLRDLTGETAILLIRDGDSIVTVAAAFSRQEVRWVREVGMRQAFGRGMSSLIFLTEQPDEETERRIVPGAYDGYWDFLSKDEVMALLREARETGKLSVVVRPRSVTILSFGVRGAGGSLVAAIAIGGPDSRWTRERIAAMWADLQPEVEELERRLGYRAPAKSNR